MTMAQLPKDPVMLLSFTNTQLRDFYPNLSEFCKAFMVDETEIVQTLKGIDYEYDTTRNQFYLMFGARKKRVALKYNSTTRLFFAFYNLMLFTAVLFFFDGFSALGSCRKFTVYNINHNVITRIDVTL